MDVASSPALRIPTLLGRKSNAIVSMFGPIICRDMMDILWYRVAAGHRFGTTNLPPRGCRLSQPECVSG